MTTSSTVQEDAEEEYGLLSSEERASFSQIAGNEAPYSQRAQALLALGDGATQAEAARLSDLSKGQVRYWLAKFRRDGIEIFPEELLGQAQSMTVADESGPQDLEPFQDEKASAENKSKEKSKKKSKKAKKTKKPKKENKPKKKSKKNGSPQKAGGRKGKSGKKKRKNK